MTEAVRRVFNDRHLGSSLYVRSLRAQSWIQLICSHRTGSSALDFSPSEQLPGHGRAILEAAVHDEGLGNDIRGV